MASLLHPGAVLTGRRLTYKIVKELYRATDNGAVYFAEYVHEIGPPRQ